MKWSNANCREHFYLPILHLLRLQGTASVDFPWHSLPPYIGAGSLQVRDLNLSPMLHVTEHEDHDDHLPQWPSTGAKNSKQYKLNFQKHRDNKQYGYNIHKENLANLRKHSTLEQ